MITTKENSALSRCRKTSGIGRNRAENVPKAAIAAFITSETSKRNPTANTSANENNRSRAICMMVLNPVVCAGGISQMVFKASRSSISTPDAPNSNVRRPIAVAIMPWVVWRVPSRTV